MDFLPEALGAPPMAIAIIASAIACCFVDSWHCNTRHARHVCHFIFGGEVPPAPPTAHKRELSSSAKLCGLSVPRNPHTRGALRMEL